MKDEIELSEKEKEKNIIYDSLERPDWLTDWLTDCRLFQPLCTPFLPSRFPLFFLTYPFVLFFFFWGQRRKRKRERERREKYLIIRTRLPYSTHPPHQLVCVLRYPYLLDRTRYIYFKIVHLFLLAYFAGSLSLVRLLVCLIAAEAVAAAAAAAGKD